jgi:hypothetical protein
VTEVALIHTIRGNLPVDSLSYSVEWTVTDTLITFIERYRAANGELVRQDAHFKALVGPSTDAILG